MPLGRARSSGMRSVIHLLSIIHVFAVLLLAHGSTLAAAPVAPIISYTPSGGVVISPLAGTTTGEISARTWSNFMSGANATGDVLVQDALKAKVGTGTADMTLKRGLSWGAVSKATARALPLLSVGAAGYGVYEGVRCYGKSGSAGKGIVAGLEAALTLSAGSAVACDPGIPPVQAMQLVYFQPTYPECADKATPQEVFNCVGDLLVKKPSSGTLSEPGWSATKSVEFPLTAYSPARDSTYGYGTWKIVWTCQTPCTPNGYSTTGYNAVEVYKQSKLVDQCPAYTDARGPQAAGAPKGSDGKCPSGTFQATTPEVAASKLNVLEGFSKVADFALARDMIREAAEIADQWDAVDRTPLMEPCTNCSAGTLGGQAVVTGTATTVVKKDAAGNTIGTTTTTPKHNLTYEKNEFKVVTSVVTGDQTGATEETTNPEAQEMACGVAGKPACNVKVDETGTPTGVNPSVQEGEFKARADEVLAKIGAAPRTEFGFTWGWMPPTGTCVPFHFFTNRLGDFVVDPCNSTGVFAWRALLGWFLASLTLLYIWRSGVELKG